MFQRLKAPLLTDAPARRGIRWNPRCCRRQSEKSALSR